MDFHDIDWLKVWAAFQIGAMKFLRGAEEKIGTLVMRGWRPAVGWVGIYFLLSLGASVIKVFQINAARGAFPDMNGGLASIAEAVLPLLIPFAIAQITRHLEVRRQREPYWPQGAPGMDGPPAMGPGAEIGCH